MNITGLVLHPAYKLRYFKIRQWEQAWIDTAQDLVESEFASEYANLDVPRMKHASTSEDGASSAKSTKVRP